MRPGNYWQYLLICACALGVAHAKLLPTGEYVASVYQQVIEALQGKPPYNGGELATASCPTGTIRAR